MEKFFNTQGPCEPSRHYMLPATARLPTIRRLIEQGKYVVLHAPRQVGKTTALRALARELTDSGRYVSLAISLEVGAAFSQEAGIAMAERAVLREIWEASQRLPPDLRPPPPPASDPGAVIRTALAAWARTAPRPLVLFLDEIDALRGPVLLSFLRQLRSGYAERPEGAPWSIALCGMRDVRDYRLEGEVAERSHSSSPFNVKESLTMRLFTAEEVAALYQQHTEATGQVFADEATQRVFELTQGQPWLVNALGEQLVDVEVPDRAAEVRAAHVERAKDAIILRRETHLDSLMERLKEPRVRSILEPILVGADLAMDVANDDLLYARDLGLVTDQPNVRIANPIYAEILPRTLTYVMQASLVQEAAWYVRPNGTLDMVLMLAAFQEFFAENSEAWLDRFDYKEAGPHLLLQAFLQRVVNGGGRIVRELAVGSGRADLCVEFGGGRSVLELKLRRGADTEQKGIEQLCRYLDRMGETEGHLVIFDRRAGRSWADKLDLREVAGIAGQRIYLFAM